MKKVIIACLALISLVSCSNNNKIEQKQAVRTTSPAEITTEAEIPPATEPETISEVLYQDDNLTIIYNKYDSLSTVQRIYLTFDNNSEYYVRAIASDIKINGIAINQNFSTELESKNTISTNMTILNSKLQNENITKVNEIEFKMQIKISDLQNNQTVASYDTDTMNIKR